MCMACIKRNIYPFYLYFKRGKMIFWRDLNKDNYINLCKTNTSWEKERMHQHITFDQLQIKILMRHNLLNSGQCNSWLQLNLTFVSKSKSKISLLFICDYRSWPRLLLKPGPGPWKTRNKYRTKKNVWL